MSRKIARQSKASWLASLAPHERLKFINSLTPGELLTLEHDWSFWGRPDQQEPPGNWSTWLTLCGRGWGKTETGAQWLRQRVANGAMSIAIIAETQKDLEEVMVPRIIAVHPEVEAPKVRYKPVRLTWPNGATALGYNGTEPDQLRGPEFDTAWVDELAKYRYAQEVWDMLQFTMRRSEQPRVLVTTTPRPLPIVRAIKADARTYVTRGSTFDNAENLPKIFLDKLQDRYAGTRLGRQELEAEVLDDVPGALWTRTVIEQARAARSLPDLRRTVVAIDPSGARSEQDEGADSIGIVVVGLGVDGRYYVLADLTCRMSPAGWGARAIQAYHRFSADAIVAETNYGGAMVEATIRQLDKNVKFIEVKASRGKVVRAEPISALYEQGKVSHALAYEGEVVQLDQLEDQMCLMTGEGFMGDGSPDRVDALVWGISSLASVTTLPRITPAMLAQVLARRAG